MNLSHQPHYQIISRKDGPSSLLVEVEKGECAHNVMICRIPYRTIHRLVSKYTGSDPLSRFKGGVIQWLYTVEEVDGFQVTAMKGSCDGHTDYDQVVKMINDLIAQVNPYVKLQQAKPVLRTTEGVLAKADEEFLSLVFPD